jgi:allantoinase
MTADLYLANAQVVTEESVFHGGVVVKDGKIAQVVTGDAAIDAATVVDLGGKVLLPGVVDGHVHLNEPGREIWETYRNGTSAAAAGGVTTVVDMPLNSSPPTVNRTELERKQRVAATQAIVDYALWGGLVNNNLANLDELHQGGVVGFKAFMTSNIEYPRVDDDLIFAGLVKTRELDSLVGVHAENEYYTRYMAETLRAEGRLDLAAWPESRPPVQELEAIQRAIYWAKATGGRLHIVHVTIAEGMRAAAQAKLEGVRVTVETCPQYLLLDLDDYLRIGPHAKCAPPIRTRAHVEALWECVHAGIVDTIGSDHAPCTPGEKEIGVTDIWQAWGGISGLQTLLPAILSEGVAKRGLPLPMVARLMAANPARVFGLYPQKGTIQPGADADLVIVDLQRQWTLHAADLLYLHKQSAFDGYTFTGAVERTYVRGQAVYADGSILVEPGHGRLLTPITGSH